MKILFYNWIKFDKKNNFGGGVNVYQKNLIEYFISNSNDEIYFLSSGTDYDLINKKVYVKETSNIYGNKCKSYTIVNSTCTAPIKAMSRDLQNFLDDKSLYEVFKSFIKKCGGFDVIHFNNIEGLSSKCLEIKKDFPNTRVIFSIHNYNLFCPQTNLFCNNQCNCLNYDDGKKCYDCLATSNISQKKAIYFYKIDGICEKLHMYKMPNKIRKLAKRKSKTSIVEADNYGKDANLYMRYRMENVKRINNYVDSVLAVSNRVRDIAIAMNINKDKISTCYIGTEIANKVKHPMLHRTNNEFFKIAYMGYFYKIKGFDFLIDALGKLPNEISEKLDFECYAKINSEDDNKKVELVEKLNNKLHSSKHFNGYTHNDLERIHSEIDLGIVPVIWEDNLPQVAIEFVADGVPILCSNLGGAQELSNSKYFVYEAGNTKDFIEHLKYIINNRDTLQDYFNQVGKLTSMKEHINELQKYYRGESYGE